MKPILHIHPLICFDGVKPLSNVSSFDFVAITHDRRDSSFNLSFGIAIPTFSFSSSFLDEGRVSSSSAAAVAVGFASWG